MILRGGMKFIIGPGGRQSTIQLSVPRFASCRLACSCAHGCASEGLKSDSNFGPVLQRPDRSGLPSCVRGAAADKSGLPSEVRGMPGVGCVSHCPDSIVGIVSRVITVKTADSLARPYLMGYLPLRCWAPFDASGGPHS